MTPEEAVLLRMDPRPGPALEHKRFPLLQAQPLLTNQRQRAEVSPPQEKRLTALHGTADHRLLFPPAFSRHHGVLHPHGQGEVVTQPLVSIWPIHQRHLGSLAAIEPVDEAAVLAVVHRESRSPVGSGARHRQQVNLS